MGTVAQHGDHDALGNFTRYLKGAVGRGAGGEAYEKAVEVIEAIAKERGLDLVLLKQTGDLSSQMLLQEVTSNILVRSVVYSRANIDITDEVKNRMQ